VRVLDPMSCVLRSANLAAVQSIVPLVFDPDIAGRRSNRLAEGVLSMPLKMGGVEGGAEATECLVVVVIVPCFVRNMRIDLTREFSSVS
jgi:hypothetical protein